jgi:superfamily II DNA or RNA helicase
MQLRQYQIDVIRDVDAAVQNCHRRILVVAPTGAGKTVIAASVIRNAVSEGRRILFLAHRRELIAQAHRKLYDQDIDAGIILAGYPSRPLESVQVASIQTLHARAIRSRSIDLPPADLVIVDEAHHARAKTYRKIIDSYPDAVILGLTATPCRADGKGLGNIFDAMIECPQVSELIAGGFLVQTRVYAPSQPDLKGVDIARGDYVKKQLAKRVDQPKLIGDIVTHWHRLANGRPTLVFATSIEHSLHLCDEFGRSVVLAEHLDGSTPVAERERILAGLKTGRIEVVVNVGVLPEGFDCPDVSCIVLARPTKSLGLYRQMIGRGLRPASDKSYCLILDHAGAVYAHGLPEDRIDWTLRTDHRAENHHQAERSDGGRMRKLTICPECAAVRLEGKPCEEVDRSRLASKPVFTADDKRRFHAQLSWIARERAYKLGWAAWKYREKFGSWPKERFPDPEPPDESVRSWVRSRQIAFAKSRKAGAA